MTFFNSRLSLFLGWLHTASRCLLQRSREDCGDADDGRSRQGGEKQRKAKAGSPSLLELGLIKEACASRQGVADHCCHELLSAVVRRKSCRVIFVDFLEKLLRKCSAVS